MKNIRIRNLKAVLFCISFLLHGLTANAQSNFIGSSQNALSIGGGLAFLDDFSIYSGKIGISIKGSVDLGVIFNRQVSEKRFGIYNININSIAPYINILVKKAALEYNDLGIEFGIGYESARIELLSDEYLELPNSEYAIRNSNEFGGSSYSAKLKFFYNIANSENLIIQPNFSVTGIKSEIDDNNYFINEDTFVYVLGLALGKKFSNQIFAVANPSIGWQKSERFFIGITLEVIFTTLNN